MKNRLLISSFLAAGIAFSANSQTSGGASVGGGAAGAGGTAGVGTTGAGATGGTGVSGNGANVNGQTSVNGVNGQGSVNGSVQGSVNGQTQIGVGTQNGNNAPNNNNNNGTAGANNNNNNSPSTTTQQRFGTSGQATGANQFGTATQFNSGFTSAAPFTATGQSTNGSMAGNGSFSATNGGSATVTQDTAATPTDQTLLLKVRQSVLTSVFPTLGTGTTTVATTLPVHFLINNGLIRVVGVVPTTDQRQRILMTVQRVPGVAQVVDDLQVNPSGTFTTQGAVTEDVATTSADQALLVTIRQSVPASPLAPAGTAAAVGTLNVGLPVHFIINNGLVRVIGTTPTVQEQEQLLTTLQRIPGVVQVVNETRVDNNQGASVNTTGSGSTAAGGGTVGVNATGASVTGGGAMVGASGSASASNNLSATSVSNGQNRVFANTNSLRHGPQFSPIATTNLAPTSRTSLPPGLEKREQLPPGLQNREQLPPGLRTNTATP
jgi:hypothetical protein